MSQSVVQDHCSKQVSPWVVYIILCSDESLYTGITTDIVRRFNQHLHKKGAKYFRGREPIEVVYLESCTNRAHASRREAQIKRLSVLEKRFLIEKAKISETFRKKMLPLSRK